MKVNIKNISKDFVNYYEQSREKNFDEKSKLWKVLYEKKNKDIFDAYLKLMRIFDKDYRLENRYEHAFNRYNNDYKNIKKVSENIDKYIIETCDKCNELFNLKNEKLELNFVLLVGLYMVDGWVTEFNNKTTAFFAIEYMKNEDAIKVFLAHEITHNIQNNLIEFGKITLAERLFIEGIAVAASEELCNIKDKAFCIYHNTENANEIVEKCELQWTNVKLDIIDNLDNKSDEYTSKYFGGDTGNENLPKRSGYLYGYNIIKELLKTNSFEELLRWNKEKIICEIKKCIITLK